MNWLMKACLSVFAVAGCSMLVSLNGGMTRLLASPKFVQALQSAGDPQLNSILAKYYEGYGSLYTFEQRITESAAVNNGHMPSDVEIVKTMENGIPGSLPEFQLPPNASLLVRTQVSNADLIIMGVPFKGLTLPIQDRTFLFTEYEVRVDRVIFAGQRSIVPGDIITVSRGGGEMIVDGILVKAIEPAFENFRINKQYIFMLHRVPQTDSYRALGAGTFLVENGTVGTISPTEARANPKRSLENFFTELNDAVAHKRSHQN